MTMLDDNSPSMLSLVALQGNGTPAAPPDEFGKTILTQDSITRTVADSLKNMDLDDLKGVVTGENTILKDGLHALTELTVGFVPKLLVAILGSLVDVLLKAMIIIMAMDVVGIKATSFIALLGAMGLAIGMALQGTLQNFAGGVIILLMKPFKVGDYIECGNFKGYIQEIRIFHTIMRPFNGRTIVIPNSELSNKSLVNHTKEEVIRLDVVASVAYGSDLDKVKEVLMGVISEEPLIVYEPKAPVVAVSELGNSSVDFSMWMWVKVEDYWTVWLRIRENVYKAFYRNGITIPFPQLDVHLASDSRINELIEK